MSMDVRPFNATLTDRMLMCPPQSVDMALAESRIAESLRLSSKYRQSALLQRTARFPAGLEWDVLIADATVLSGLIHVFSETYLGYARCIAKAKFTNNPFKPEGPLEEFIVSGAAFCTSPYIVIFFLIQPLVSMIRLVQSGIVPIAQGNQIVGLFGLTFDQRSALQALRVAAGKNKNDARSVFARLVLMLYLSFMLQMTPWQADKEQLRKDLLDPSNRVVARYPSSNLWAVYRAKLMPVPSDQNGAIAALEEGTRPGRPLAFKQADMLVVYELGWTLAGERRHEEAAKLFMEMQELNQWYASVNIFHSNVTRSAGAMLLIIFSLQLDEGQRLLDDMPSLVGKKVAGKAPLTEVFLKKLEFYKEKQQRSARPDAKYVEFIKIGLADEVGPTSMRI
ncbi:hypothetical protein AX14_003002 [Amanita brunnescens Koide BX004]|nr:hypothetical protein AX14_003002 [Amanita brunnescens Koide BX004]